MTDNEIIKALERCENADCFGCPFDGEMDCVHKSAKLILDLINRQKAKLERLADRNVELWGENRNAYNKDKSEAIKEFVDRLNKEAENVVIDREGDFVATNNKIYDTVSDWCKETSDNLLKEMTGENNGN